ncbi:response regulator transcription factor [Azospirillum sp. B21]|uniref:response regulator transcription factor n=1 Tax=unclassified Azospirillum TaxID=2630922 RepID=UPI0011EBF2FD|nr:MULTISPECIES: response regulator transcription factor [unclassified Azospirillum]KAA0575379.1 response regulator transcription factor [Azospirillum sp. B21]MDR6774378.1 DNA-binding NarL/FixJ family response regulator [Azospirillum sp. BE72]
MTRILIADDHPMVRDALRSAVLYSCQATDVMEADRLDSVMQALEERGDLDLVLLDVNMPGMNGLGGLRTLRQRFPATPVVVVSAHEERRWVREAMESGAAGFIPKSTPRDAIAAALRQVLNGELYVPPQAGDDGVEEAEDAETAEIARRIATLTAQQLRVLELLGTGKLNKEIAFDLSITETTVKAHVSAILQKLKVYSRTQAVVIANRVLAERR